jgi:hypothetical protein
MNFALRPLARFASGVGMRSLLVRLAIIFSVFMAGMHAPEAAHALERSEIGLHHDHHDARDAPEDRSDGGVPQGVGGEALHHHHCPIGLASGNPVNGLAVALASETPHPAKAATLTSRATAPSLEPPLV